MIYLFLQALSLIFYIHFHFVFMIHHVFFPISDVWVDFKPHLIPHGWVQYHVPPGVASWELGVWGQRSPETGGGWQRLHCAEVPGQQGG
jgi:hypothetical protein